ncbi:MAG: hypothetical protein ACKPKO_26875, partial [Candidatus Fonsibacter sp.]
VVDLTLYVPNTQELRGISVCDLRHYLGLPVGRAAYSPQSEEHTMARLISGILRHSGSVIPPKDRRPSPANGFGLEIDTGGWYMVDEVIHAVNEYTRTSRRVRLPLIDIAYLAKIASSGTEDKTKLRWQFCVRLLKKPPHSNATFLERIQGVYGIRAVVGHTGMPFLEDDRLMVSAQSLSCRDVPFAVHNTKNG